MNRLKDLQKLLFVALIVHSLSLVDIWWPRWTAVSDHSCREIFYVLWYIAEEKVNSKSGELSSSTQRQYLIISYWHECVYFSVLFVEIHLWKLRVPWHCNRSVLTFHCGGERVLYSLHHHACCYCRISG